MSKSYTKLFSTATQLVQAGKLDEAIDIYQSIQKEDSPEWFANAQVNLGVLFYKQGKVSEAIGAWQLIQKEDSRELFANAQLNLGVLFDEQGKASEAIEAWQLIQREDSRELFAKAQFNLGVLFDEQGKASEAIAAYQSIQRDDSFEQFIEAKVFLNYGKGNKNREILLSVFKCVQTILSQLKINHDDERNIAHYTRPSIGHFLLQMDKHSKFRLSTIKGVNDPEEGKVLSKLLKYHSDEDNLLTFISCFTFNHDSLNQFRLYGKENGEESSGISLVFNKNKFFDQNTELYTGIKISNYQVLSASKSQKVQVKNIGDEVVPQLPLYRCIYLEPFDNNKPYYLHVACREELTFYRENNKGNPEDRWKGYQKAITEIEKNVKNALDTIRDSVKELNDELSTGTDLKNILEEILLPLKYLVKHSAFREEQECRMIYITDICDKRIKSDFEKNQMYVEYAPSVKDAVHKIYLSSGASKYRDYFRKLLADKGCSKVISSTNPFRVKT